MEIIQNQNNTTFIILILFIGIMLLIEYNKKLKYFFNGRLISEHTLNNLLQQASYHDDTIKAQNYLEKVGHIVRFGYQFSQQMIVPLEDELKCCEDMVDAYFSQKKQKVKINYSVPTNLLEYKIPPYSITVLIENALKHGITCINEQHIDLSITSNKYSIQIYLSGYRLPDSKFIRNPKKAHGLFYLKNRVNYFNYYYGCSYLDAIFIRDNQLVLNFAKQA
jgi:LytS/YehU family sensor histidine kinase